MKRIGRSTKQMSGLLVVLALLAGGLVPPGGAQERKAKQPTSQNKDFEAESHIPDQPGKIAFASDRDGNFEIYVMNPDGGGLTRVTDNSAEDTHPTWSPDGTQLAFVSNRDGNKEIYVVGADGGAVTRLTNNAAEDIEPAWSPALTNQQIAFVSHRDGNDNVYVMNADGTSQTALTENTGDDVSPTWAPSGTLLAFASNRDGDKFEIYRMASDGASQIRLTNNSFNDVSPAWPAGRISFQSDRDGNDEIYTMNVDGSNQTRITNNAAFDLDPARSSDGSRVVWVSNRDEATNLEIYAANADGSNVVRLTNNAASDVDPSIQPLPSAATLGTIQLSAASFTVGEGEGSVSINVTRTGGTGAAMVDIETISGTASERMDFAPIFRTLTFAAGETSKTVNVAIVDDAYNEGDETFTVTLGNPTGAVLGSPNTATVTIVDNETSTAVTLYGVTPAGNGLVRFNSATPGTIDSTIAITGLQSGENVLGIDVRPATLQLYILGSTSRLYTLDPGTGTATQVGTGTFATALNGTSFGFDFNPTVDRIRVTSDADQNLRLHPDTGAVAFTDTALAYAAADTNAGQNPNVVGSAYTNNVAGATTTVLYNIDSGRDVLVTQNPPNNGTLNTVGALGVDTTDVVGFDITNPGGTAYAALSVGGNSQLYTINLTTGAATLVGNIGGTAISGLTAVNPAPNPIDETRFFVRQQYLDFLNREPDPAGQEFWVNQITKCGVDANCINLQRVNVSAEFFNSAEFQERGGFLIRAYLASLNRRITYNEFLRDQGRLADLGGNQQAFLEEFVERPEFVALHGTTTNAQYLDALDANSGDSLTQAEEDALLAGLNNGTESRASVLRQVTDNTVFRQAQRNRAFVLMQYIGYLRRDPDQAGFDFWLNILNTSGNFRAMVCAFITSAEYQARFGSVRSRTDAVCGTIAP